MPQKMLIFDGDIPMEKGESVDDYAKRIALALTLGCPLHNVQEGIDQRGSLGKTSNCYTKGLTTALFKDDQCTEITYWNAVTLNNIDLAYNKIRNEVGFVYHNLSKIGSQLSAYLAEHAKVDLNNPQANKSERAKALYLINLITQNNIEALAVHEIVKKQRVIQIC